MNAWSRKQKLLVGLAPALVLIQIAVFQLLVQLWGDTLGYFLGYMVYWLIWCIPASLFLLGGKSITERLKHKWVSSKKGWIAVSLVMLPAIATGIAVFPQYAAMAGWPVILLALFFAILNAPIEELFWRGVFPKMFPDSLWLGFVYPAVCFGAWHLAPALVKDSGMDGGMLSFVGGALFMGVVWGWYAYRYQTILPSTISHLLTNWFAFTGFLYVNWFA